MPIIIKKVTYPCPNDWCGEEFNNFYDLAMHLHVCKKPKGSYACRNQRPDINGCRGGLPSGRRKPIRVRKKFGVVNKSPYKSGVECNGMCCTCKYVGEQCSLVFKTKNNLGSITTQCYRRCKVPLSFLGVKLNEG